MRQQTIQHDGAWGDAQAAAMLGVPRGAGGGVGYRRWLMLWAGVVCVCVASLAVAQADAAAPGADATRALGQRDRVREHLGGVPEHDVMDPLEATTVPASGARGAVGDGDRGIRVQPGGLYGTGENDRPIFGEGDPVAGSGLGVWDTLKALGVVIALVFAVRWVWQKVTGQGVAVASMDSGDAGLPGAGPIVRVLGRTAIAPKSQVVLLHVGERVLAVSDHPSGVRTLASFEDADEVATLLARAEAARVGASSGFARLLGGLGREEGSALEVDDAVDAVDEVGPARARDAVRGVMVRARQAGRDGRAGRDGARTEVVG